MREPMSRPMTMPTATPDRDPIEMSEMCLSPGCPSLWRRGVGLECDGADCMARKLAVVMTLEDRYRLADMIQDNCDLLRRVGELQAELRSRNQDLIDRQREIDRLTDVCAYLQDANRKLAAEVGVLKGNLAVVRAGDPVG